MCGTVAQVSKSIYMLAQWPGFQIDSWLNSTLQPQQCMHFSSPRKKKES